MISIPFAHRLRPAYLWSWLQGCSVGWVVAIGAVLGIGIGSAALWELGLELGALLCLIGVGVPLWAVRNAEPVWSDGKIDDPPPDPPSEPLPDPPFVEPLEMVELDSGVFLMGSPDSDDEASDPEKPQHEVSLSGFYMGRFVITRDLYRELMDVTPEAWEPDGEDDRLPANYVSWLDAVAFCNALSERVGLDVCYRIDGETVTWDANADGYRLPTEAEWEYACRAGTTTKWFCGDEAAELERFAWFEQSSLQPVGQKEPNPWGLYDMAGNVFEWCWDWHGDYGAASVHDPVGPDEGESRALRGGAFNDEARFLRSADRDWFGPEVRSEGIGFRCVRRPRRQS